MINGWTNKAPRYEGSYMVKLRSGAVICATFIDKSWRQYSFEQVGATEYFHVTDVTSQVIGWASPYPLPGEQIPRRHTRKAGSYFNCIAKTC